MQLTRGAAAVIALAWVARPTHVRADAPPPPAELEPTPLAPLPPVAPPPVPQVDEPDPTLAPPGSYVAPPAVVETAPDPGEPWPKTVRVGQYADNDHTTVRRLFAAVSHAVSHWQTSASFTVDAVTSASLDVRASPRLSHVDVVTSASGTSSTSGGRMTDTRYQVTGAVGYNDAAGHTVTATAAAATETDYASLSAGANVAYDILDRNATLLAGVTVTDNWVSSVLDPSFHGKLFAVGYTAGLARVLTRDDAIRLRYDGRAAFGDQASPYRNVRFGDWTTSQSSTMVTFANTIGSADGLTERDPERRYAHALVLEWVHSLVPGVGLHPEVRVAHDSWGLDSLAAGAELRLARGGWRLVGGYRYYTQNAADFFLDKYTQSPDHYAYYSFDKDLGHERGHTTRLHVARVLSEPKAAGDTRLLLELQLEVLDYRYPGFTLLPSRDGTFVSLGLATELP